MSRVLIMSPRRFAALPRVVLAWMGLTGVPAGVAAEAPSGLTVGGTAGDIVLELKSAEGDGWRAADLHIVVSGTEGQLAARLTLGQLNLAALREPLRDVRIECRRLEVSAEAFGCDQARIVAYWPLIGPQILGGRLRYERKGASLDVSLHGRQAQGTAMFEGGPHARDWRGELQLSRVPLALLLELARALALPVDGWSAQGEVDLSLGASGSGTELRAASVAAKVAALTANNDSGSLAGDQLGMQLRARLHEEAGMAGEIPALHFTAQLESGSGQAYVQPFFLDFGAHALSLRAAGRFVPGRLLSIEQFNLAHADVALATAKAQIGLGGRLARPFLRSLHLDSVELRLPGAYESYLQPLLMDTDFKSMHTAGRIKGDLVIEDELLRDLALTLDELDIDAHDGDFALTGLSGQVNWSRSEQSRRAAAGARQAGVEAADGTKGDALAEEVALVEGMDGLQGAASSRASHLHWRGGALFGLAAGAGELDFTIDERQFRLLRSTRIPILDGALDVERLRIHGMGSADMAFVVDAEIVPISVRELCKAFGWPQFGGRLGGKVSSLRMRKGVLTLGTSLRAQIFDGELQATQLRLEEPFSAWPRFYSNLVLDNLDLELLTGAFSFGRISGRLSGTVDGLQLFNWMPVAFDARLHTPERDRSRHRISQRAVQDIGSIGGGGAGAAAALSSGFLRFFDDFNYERLGVSCRLQNDVCTMGGVEERADGTYYLVKGRGLPRIDVIGSSQLVDWPRLVQQLMAVMQAEGPVVR